MSSPCWRRSAAPPVIRQWLVETGLRGWACEIRTQKCRGKLSARAPGQGRPLCRSQRVSLALSSQVDRPVRVALSFYRGRPMRFAIFFIGELLRQRAFQFPRVISMARRTGTRIRQTSIIWNIDGLGVSSALLAQESVDLQRAQLGQETDQIVQPATQPVHRRGDHPVFVESSPLSVSV
jgi:hypothetical protein